jgi:CheY-like chemotaxis protein
VIIPTKISWRHVVIGIVDDSTEWRRTVRAMCVSYGANQIYDASDGASFLQIATEGGQPFDLLLVDDDMQPVDGYLMLRHLRTTETHPSRRAAAILMPGQGGNETLRQALQAGFHGVLAKPFSSQALGDRAERLLIQPMAWREENDFLCPVLPKPAQA